METINHEYYVSLEVAKLLKEAGFNWECRGYYDRRTLRFNFVWNHNEKGASTQCSAPTLDVAQRWLREVKDVDILVRIDYHYGEDYSKAYCCTFYIGDELYTAEHFKIYEEAQEAGIKKALEIILEKGE